MASDGEISCTNDPNFAVIFSFLKVFGELYGLEIPTLSKLQELIENTEEVLEPLKDIHLRLLRRALKSVQSSRWEKCLIKFCHQQSYHQEAWEIERFSYKKASTQVKLKVFKLLLEYQFTCHVKFKNTINNIHSKELRLNPIGKDKNGCVYWYQVDHEANLCLYKEDQDEETWQLIARTREELQKVIAQLKSGEISLSPSANESIGISEDSSSNEASQNIEPLNDHRIEDDNDEEFLSPESETDHESDTQNERKSPENLIVKESTKDTVDNVNTVNDEAINLEYKETVKDLINETSSENTNLLNKKELSSDEHQINEESNNTNAVKSPVRHNKVSEQKITISTHDIEEEKEQVADVVSEDANKEKDNESVSEAIEEPVMVITGEGNGADCESSYFFGEEISEPVMYIHGAGWGFDNDTGNPEAEEKDHSEDNSNENPAEECNGEYKGVTNCKNKLGKGVKLKSVKKRLLKKQSADNNESVNVDSKKQCKREPERSSNSTITHDSDKKEISITDQDFVNNPKKKLKGKLKKNLILRKGVKKGEKLNSVAETDKCQNGKTSIIEKRKSSLSSDQDDVGHTESENSKTPEPDLKEDTLPSKKLRLEPTDVDVSPSKETDTLDSKNDISNDNIENKDLNVDENLESISNRKKIKAKKGKLKSKKFLNKDKEELNTIDKVSEEKKHSKALKRSLINSTLSDENKSESQSESEEDEPLSSGKRFKIKPKKIITSTRKKVEAKHMAKSSSESEEETLYSLAGKKSAKKLKKKFKNEKEKSKLEKCEDGDTPVRQSRRIAQMKIKEEADRRHLEEVTLRELKMIHKKKNKDDEEDWKASCSSSESEHQLRKKQNKWKASDSTGPDQDSDSDEPLFEPQYEPEYDFNKSDHEFSPESDLESEEPMEPVKRARTLQEAEADGDGACRRCGSGEQPEWILLCDKCDAGYHASCLKPMLFLIPDSHWFCPPCEHVLLIEALEKELMNYDELVTKVDAEREKRLLEEPQIEKKEIRNDTKEEIEEKSEDESEGSESWSSSSSSGAVYRLRARKQLPVSYRSREYDRLISSAIKEEYSEATTSAGNQGRGKDISTIIEAAEEEKMKAEREAIEQGMPVEAKKATRKQRRKGRKLNSLDVPSEDDDETDEDFKDTGLESSSSDISSRSSSSETPSDEHIEVKRIQESPDVKKKKKGVFDESSSESALEKEHHKSKPKKSSSKKRDKSRRFRRSGLTQYDAAGNVIRARVTYGGLSDEPNDWSPKHRTRQKKINYMEMPNTESEDEMHKSSGKHMPDSSDEFKLDDSELSSDESVNRKQNASADEEEKRKTISELINKTAVVPLEKLPDDVTKAKTEALQAHLEAQETMAKSSRSSRGKRGGRGSRGGRGRGRGSRVGASDTPSEDVLSKLVGIKIKDLRTDNIVPTANQVEREKKRQERETKQAEKEARKMERLQKKEEKEKLKEMKAKEREEKKQAKLALQESRRLKREGGLIRPPGDYVARPDYPAGRPDYPGPRSDYPGSRPDYPGARPEFPGGRPPDFPERYQHNQQPRLQVRPELRGIAGGEDRMVMRPDHHHVMREGTLSVAGSPQPFAPVSEEPSIITRMPHVLNHHYRGQMMYPPGGPGYGPRGQGMMYQLHPGLGPQGRPPYPQYYYPRGGPPGTMPQHGPPSSPHGPPSQGPSATPPHGPPVSSPHGPLHPPHRPPAYRPPGPHLTSYPLRPSRPDSQGSGPYSTGMHGPSSSPHGPMSQSPHRTMTQSPHGPLPQSPHAPHLPTGHGQGLPPSSPHVHNAANVHPTSSPHGLSPGLQPGIRPPMPGNPPLLIRPPSKFNASPNRQNSPVPDNFPVKIKAEVKTEPEYQSPPGSPSQRQASPDLPRNRIKHTENKARPLGPYAPQYGPYGPYAPPVSQAEALQARLHHNPLHRMGTVPPYLGDSRTSSSRSPLPGIERMPFEALRPDRPMPHDGSHPLNRGLQEMLRAAGPEKFMMRHDRPIMHEINRPPSSEGSILHDMIRAPIRPIIHEMLRPPLERQPSHSMAESRFPATQLQSLARPPAPERNMPHDMRYHEMSRPDRSMHDMSRPAALERPMHDIVRHSEPDRSTHDVRPAAPERPMHDLLRPPGSGGSSHSDRPRHDPIRPFGPERPLHDMLRPPESINDKLSELPGYVDRNLIHDMSQPHPDIRTGGPERLVAHDVPPHYPYMRPQLRAPYGMPIRPPALEPGNLGPTSYAQYGDVSKQLQMRESVLMRKPSPKPNEETRETESPQEEEPPLSPPETKPIIPKLEENVNSDVAIKLSNIKVEQPSDIPRDKTPPVAEESQAPREMRSVPREEGSGPRDEGSVFGGLVSYFSSQREEDLDA